MPVGTPDSPMTSMANALNESLQTLAGEASELGGSLQEMVVGDGAPEVTQAAAEEEEAAAAPAQHDKWVVYASVTAGLTKWECETEKGWLPYGDDLADEFEACQEGETHQFSIKSNSSQPSPKTEVPPLMRAANQAGTGSFRGLTALWSGTENTYVIRWKDFMQVNVRTGVMRKVRRTVNGIQTHPHSSRPSSAGAVGVAPISGGKCPIRHRALPYEERMTGVWYWHEDLERAKKMAPEKVMMADGKPFVEYDVPVYEDIEEKYQAYLARVQDPEGDHEPKGVVRQQELKGSAQFAAAAEEQDAAPADSPAEVQPDVRKVRIHIRDRMFQGGTMINAIRQGLNLKPTSMDFDIDFVTMQQENAKTGFKRAVLRREVPVSSLPSSNPSITVEHSIFKYRNQKGDFLYEITRRPDISNRTLYIFNDNAEHHYTSQAGGGNANIRIFNRFGPIMPVRSAGISTGWSSSSGGFCALTDDVKARLDLEFLELHALLATGAYYRLVYSGDASDPTSKTKLGTGIFNVHPDVKAYIVMRLRKLQGATPASLVADGP